MRLGKYLLVLIPFLLQADPPSRTPIHDAVVRAKKAGASAVTLPPTLSTSLMFQDIDTALKDSYWVEATLLEKQALLVRAPVETLSTYLHFFIDRQLKPVPIPTGEMPPHVPESLRHLGARDLVVKVHDTGQLAIDGVLVTNGWDLSEFVVGRRYFMLASFNGTPRASFSYGLHSVWEFSGSKVIPIRPESPVAKTFRATDLEDLSKIEQYISSHLRAAATSKTSDADGSRMKE